MGSLVSSEDDEEFVSLCSIRDDGDGSCVSVITVQSLVYVCVFVSRFVAGKMLQLALKSEENFNPAGPDVIRVLQMCKPASRPLNILSEHTLQFYCHSRSC